MEHFREDSWHEKLTEDPNEFKKYQGEALKAANELYYGRHVMDRIANSVTIGEIQRIMVSARKAKFDKDL